jgi:hypothetical protein
VLPALWIAAAAVALAKYGTGNRCPGPGAEEDLALTRPARVTMGTTSPQGRH